MYTSKERLRLLGLPVFDTIDELAELIHVSVSHLKLLVERSDRFYKRYTIPKSHGGTREILQPSHQLKAIQAWILRNILDKLIPSTHATAFIKKSKGLIQNVLPHAENRYFICIDLEDYFPSIRTYHILSLFQLIGYPLEASIILTRLCTCNYYIPQGGVTSPSLSNLVTYRLDRRLSGLTSRRNIIYTRYADDMTFSSNNRNVLNKSLIIILEIIESEGFKPNLNKTRVMGPRMHCEITGLVKNSSEPRFGIGRRTKRRMRAVMHRIANEEQTDTKYKTHASIEGWLAYLNSVDIDSYHQMSRYWSQLNQ